MGTPEISKARLCKTAKPCFRKKASRGLARLCVEPFHATVTPDLLQPVVQRCGDALTGRLRRAIQIANVAIMLEIAERKG
jgi:hypothetical protein